MQRNPRVGLGLALVAAATFGTSGTFAESLIQTGWSPAGVVLARITLATVFLTGPALYALRGRWGELRRNAGLIFAFGLIAIAACQVTYFNAVSRLSVGVALMLEYLGVILIVGWLWLRHGQRPRRLTVLGAAVAIIGLALVLNLSGTTHLDPVGVLWALAAAVALAIFFALSANSDDALPAVALAWVGSAIGSLALVICAPIGLVRLHGSTSNVELASHHFSYLVPVIGLSLFAAAIAYVASIGGSRHLGAKLASFVGLAEVLFAVLFAWLFLHQLPGLMQLFGGLFIVGGVVLVRVDELRGEPAPAGTLGAQVPDTGPDRQKWGERINQ